MATHAYGQMIVKRAANGRNVMAPPPEKPAKAKPATPFPSKIKRIDDVGRY